jgi:HprK-related kinase A
MPADPVQARSAAWSLGAFSVALRTPFGHLKDTLKFLYGAHPVIGPESFVDFPVTVNAPDVFVRRVLRPQAVFRFGRSVPFYPMPQAQAGPLLEWGLNWTIATEMNGYLLIHAAVAARKELAVIMPAPPGSGKTTLAAGLMAAGWRVLSDEFAVIDPHDGLIRPCLKALSLKEGAIDLLEARAGNHLLSDRYATPKGTVTLMRPSAASVQAIDKAARVRWIVVPRYDPEASLHLDGITRSRAAYTLAANAFNYHILGERGFHALANVASQADGYTLLHGNLDAAVARIDRLADQE